MPIRLLQPEVAAKIAAGEVVERPASVVKELLENSLDAGASQVSVEIRGGGADLIRVTDNGCGIPPDELRFVAQRHATSKIGDAHDLEAIATLGFRGEALHSIAAVSQVQLTTRTAADDAAHSLLLQWGSTVSQGVQAAPPGTSVTVRDLFGNVPARRKFLRSPSAEAARISDLVSRFALAFCEVRFLLTIDGHSVITSPGDSRPVNALAAVYGAEVASGMLEARYSEPAAGGYEVWGFITPPSVTRVNRTYTSFFVNRRWIQSRPLSYALEEAYRGFLQTGRHPIAAIHISLPPQDVDVNVHPTKREVRFQHEDRVFSAVQRAIRGALLAHSPVPPLQVEQIP